MKDKAVIAFTATCIALIGGLNVARAVGLVSYKTQSEIDTAAKKTVPSTKISPESAKLLAAAKEKKNTIQKQHAKERAEADAKFKAEGWFQIQRGIYGRWCTDTCSRAEVIGNSSYWLLEVYCKERACGDIYAQLNISKGGTVVGWTNDTAYLGYGQKGILTFQKYGLGNGASYTGSLVKFNARG